MAILMKAIDSAASNGEKYKTKSLGNIYFSKLSSYNLIIQLALGLCIMTVGLKKICFTNYTGIIPEHRRSGFDVA